ncbi:MAG TPA: sigma-70 family RNA polymerase sigma factor [Pseudomonadales bacterium]|nr:sigma-70 family RNA polymerase sigma factor [Pseudomonadales bacterium]
MSSTGLGQIAAWMTGRPLGAASSVTPTAAGDAAADRSVEARQVRAAAGGDRDAFAALCRRHAPVLYRFAVRMVGEPADAEDVVQDVLLRFWHEARRFDPQRAKLSTWLHRMVHNACIDLLRRRARTPPADVETLAPPPEDSAEADRNADGVRAALDALPELDRTALILCHYQRLSQAEAAEVMGTTRLALESRLGRARRRLRAELVTRGVLDGEASS